MVTISMDDNVDCSWRRTANELYNYLYLLTNADCIRYTDINSCYGYIDCLLAAHIGQELELSDTCVTNLYHVMGLYYTVLGWMADNAVDALQ